MKFRHTMSAMLFLSLFAIGFAAERLPLAEIFTNAG